MSAVTIELDRPRKVRYTLDALRKIEERYDVDIMAGDALTFGGVDDIVWLAWLGLYHAGETPDYESTWWERLKGHFGLWEPPALTEEHVAGWLDMQNLPAFTDALNHAMGSQQVSAEEVEATTVDDPTAAGRENPRARVKAS